MKINKLCKKLFDSIQKYNKTNKCEIIMDEDIAKRYEDSSMYYFYKRSMKRLREYIKCHNNEMPTTTVWNIIAKKECYLSSESLKYMCHVKFPEK